MSNFIVMMMLKVVIRAAYYGCGKLGKKTVLYSKLHVTSVSTVRWKNEMRTELDTLCE